MYFAFFSGFLIVALSKQLRETHQEKAQKYVAAPVFGRPEAAAAAKLFIVAAGSPDLLKSCEALFAAIGEKTFIVSDNPADANLIKLTGNFLIAATIESLGEAIALVRKAGIDPHRFVEILTGTLFSAPVYKTYGAIIADEAYGPAGFNMALGLKDVSLALAAAHELRVPLPAASLIRDHFLTGAAQGQGGSDWAALAKISAKNAGL